MSKQTVNDALSLVTLGLGGAIAHWGHLSVQRECGWYLVIGVLVLSTIDLGLVAANEWLRLQLRRRGMTDEQIDEAARELRRQREEERRRR